MNKQHYPIRSNIGKAGAFSTGQLNIEIDGMKVVMAKKIILLPVNVIDKKNDAGKSL